MANQFQFDVFLSHSSKKKAVVCFPTAKNAAKLAVGYLLDELKNYITREIPLSFEPSIDYAVTKIPRFAFSKFPQADQTMTTQMKSVGEAMAIGRTFKDRWFSAQIKEIVDFEEELANAPT